MRRSSRVQPPAPLVDVHSHILPGLDDGPRNLERSLRICRAMTRQGVGAVVATPHMADGRFQASLEDMQAGTERLQEACREAGLDLSVLPGGEVRVGPGIFEFLESDRLPTLGGAGTHVLLELGQGPPPRIGPLLEQLQERGITPVLAHPERQVSFWRRPGPLSDWAAAGCLFQVTGASLLGELGRRPMQLSHHMLEAGMVHVVAGDAHKAHGKRGPSMGPAYRWLREAVGRITAAELTIRAPRRMAGLPAPGQARGASAPTTPAEEGTRS